MMHLLKDLQEEVITSDIQVENNSYRFEAVNIGTVTIEDNGVIVDVKATIDGKLRTYPVTKMQAFDLIPALANGLDSDLEYEINEIECLTI